VAELKGRVSSVTVYGSIHKLRRTVQLIAPDRELGWLIDIERNLSFEMRPRSKHERLVLTHVLIEAGLTLIAEAEAAESCQNSLGLEWSAMASWSVARLLSDSAEKLRGPGNRTQHRQGRCGLVDRARWFGNQGGQA
jgi:hypothetical protein